MPRVHHVDGGEKRGSPGSETDLDQEVWTVPAIRMKGGLPHRVPLSTGALDVLTRAGNSTTGRT